MVCRNDVAIQLFMPYFIWLAELQKQKVILPIVFLQSVRISFGASGTRK